jgi:SMI1 / KNR4 family (SUKH-1)
MVDSNLIQIKKKFEKYQDLHKDYPIRQLSNNKVRAIENLFKAKNVFLPSAYFEVVKILGEDGLKENDWLGFHLFHGPDEYHTEVIKSYARHCDGMFLEFVYPSFTKNIIMIGFDSVSNWYFLILEESKDDPTVYRWSESGDFLCLEKTFTEFILQSL